MYFGAMSPYSWFAAERIDSVLPQASWHPLMLGGIFKSVGRVSWGLTDEREAGIADCEARAASYGLGPIRWPAQWPTSDLHVARAMTYADSLGRVREYSLAAMRLSFLEGADLGERESVLEAAVRAGIAAAEMDAALSDQGVKDALRARNDEALAAGVFGVPTFAVNGRLFWGDDRLEEAAAAFAGAS
jgi:2-hydroxychromene-2-carboxylate isomerase